MKDIIREYFNQMLYVRLDDMSVEGAKENLIELVEEIADEFRDDENE